MNNIQFGGIVANPPSSGVTGPYKYNQFKPGATIGKIRVTNEKSNTGNPLVVDQRAQGSYLMEVEQLPDGSAKFNEIRPLNPSNAIDARYLTATPPKPATPSTTTGQPPKPSTPRSTSNPSTPEEPVQGSAYYNSYRDWRKEGNEGKYLPGKPSGALEFTNKILEPRLEELNKNIQNEKGRFELRHFEGPTTPESQFGITDPYMFLNTLSAGVGVARGAESLIREATRKQPDDIIAPKLAVPKFESPSDVMRSSGQRFNERNLNTAMRYMREQGATPSDLAGVIAQTLEADRQVAEQALAADIEARNQNSQIEATISGQQAQLDWQADLATEERNLKLAEASERAIAEGWQSITGSITGLAQSAYNRNMSEQANAYNQYNAYTKKLELLREKKANSPLTMSAIYAEQERQLVSLLEGLGKQMTELEKKPMFAQITGTGTKFKPSTL